MNKDKKIIIFCSIGLLLLIAAMVTAIVLIVDLSIHFYDVPHQGHLTPAPYFLTFAFELVLLNFVLCLFFILKISIKNKRMSNENSEKLKLLNYKVQKFTDIIGFLIISIVICIIPTIFSTVNMFECLKDSGSFVWDAFLIGISGIIVIGICIFSIIRSIKARERWKKELFNCK